MTEVPARILHQEDVEEVINVEIEEAELVQDVENDAEFAKRGTAVIAAPTAPGATYSQAEAASAKTAIDAIRAALTAAGITA
jgi:hypothetical protein